MNQKSVHICSRLPQILTGSSFESDLLCRVTKFHIGIICGSYGMKLEVSATTMEMKENIGRAGYVFGYNTSHRETVTRRKSNGRQFSK